MRMKRDDLVREDNVKAQISRLFVVYYLYRVALWDFRVDGCAVPEEACWRGKDHV